MDVMRIQDQGDTDKRPGCRRTNIRDKILGKSSGTRFRGFLNPCLVCVLKLCWKYLPILSLFHSPWWPQLETHIGRCSQLPPVAGCALVINWFGGLANYSNARTECRHSVGTEQLEEPVPCPLLSPSQYFNTEWVPQAKLLGCPS